MARGRGTKSGRDEGETGAAAAGAAQALDRRWHLAETPLEVDATELEFAVMRTFESFGRWQSECLAGSVALAASGPENALLHMIRMNA